jgi:hypothetical protein
MNYYLLIPFFIILILFFPIRLEGRASFNVLEMSGAYGFFVFGIKVDYQQFWIENKKLLAKKDDSLESHEFDIKGRDFMFLKVFALEIKDKTRLKEFFVFYNLGVGDAYKSAMLGGFINVALLTFMTSLKNTKPTASMGVYDTISYNGHVCQFATRLLMTISLFDVVYSLLRSVILIRKLTNTEETKNGGEK